MKKKNEKYGIKKFNKNLTGPWKTIYNGFSDYINFSFDFHKSQNSKKYKK